MRIGRKGRGRREKKNGQSMVELALVLPFLLLLLIATVETGFALRNYLMVQSANREGARLAIRTPPGDEYREYFREERVPEVFERIYTAGTEGGLQRDRMSIIITYVYVDGGTPTYEVFTSGAVTEGDSRVNPTEIASQNGTKTAQINATRQSGNNDPLENEIIVVEVFYDHRSLWFYDIIGPMGGPWRMYAQSTMRMVGTGRQTQ